MENTLIGEKNIKILHIVVNNRRAFENFSPLFLS
jgi:hypothetical protein